MNIQLNIQNWVHIVLLFKNIKTDQIKKKEASVFLFIIHFPNPIENFVYYYFFFFERIKREILMAPTCFDVKQEAK